MAPESSTATLLHIGTSMPQRTAYPRPYDALVPKAQVNRTERVQISSPLLVSPLLAAASSVGVTLPEELIPCGPNRKATPAEAQSLTSWEMRYLALQTTQEKTWSNTVVGWLRSEDILKNKVKAQKKLLVLYNDRLALERKVFGEERQQQEEKLTHVKSKLEATKGKLSQSKAACKQAVAEKVRIDGQLIKLAGIHKEYSWVDTIRRRQNAEWEPKMEEAMKGWEKKVAARFSRGTR